MTSASPHRSPVCGTSSALLLLALGLMMMLMMMIAPTHAATSNHFTPIGLTRPTDPTAFWVEIDFPPNFVRAQATNFTISMWNYVSIGNASGLLGVSLASSSPTFLVPALQPRLVNSCYDQLGRQTVIMRSQSTYFDFEVRLHATGTVLPFLSFTCTFYAQETDSLRDSSTERFTFKRYQVTSDPIFTFTHPSTINPVYNVAPIPQSLSHVPGGFEMRFLVYTNSVGSLQVGFPASNTGNPGSIQFRAPKRTASGFPAKPQLSEDFYGRVRSLSFVDDVYSETYVDAIHVSGDPHPVALGNQTSSATAFCYLISDQNLIPNAETNVIDMDDWSQIPLYYPRSAVWNAIDYNAFASADIFFQLPGTHICSVFSITGFKQTLNAEVTTERASAANIPYSPVIVPIKTSQMSITRPYWYIAESTSHSLSITYRLPTFQRGDLIVVSKNAFNSTLFPALPWYVDTTLAPSTPSGCIPFSLNATHIAWIFLPAEFETGLGSSRFALEMACTVQLHILPGYYQQRVDLVLSVLPRASVPYYTPTAYEGVRSYSDVFKALDLGRALQRINREDSTQTDTPMARIISANFGQSHWYSSPSEHRVGELTINDATGIDFDIFKPSSATAAMSTSSSSSSSLLTTLFTAHNSLIAIAQTQPQEPGLPAGYSAVNFDNADIEQQQSAMAMKMEAQQQDTTTSSTAPDQLSDVIPVDFVTGYRLLSLTVTPLDMNISGDSYFDHESNAKPAQSFPDLVDGTSVPYTRQDQSTAIGLDAYPTQPLHLVFNLDLSWLEKKDGVDLSVFCYYILNGQPAELNIAWGDSKLYVGSDDFYHALYVQLPPTAANTPLSVRCQIPLPTTDVTYAFSRIRYHLQAGTVLELHAMDVYNRYAQTKYTSIMNRAKLIADSATATSGTKLALATYPQQLVSDSTLSATARGLVGDFGRTTGPSNINPDPTLPVQMLIYANVSFVIDYGVHNNDNMVAYLANLRQSGLSDFILPAPHMNRLPTTNAGLPDDLPRSSWRITDPLSNDRVSKSLATTRITDVYTFFLTGDIKTASVNMYDHLLAMAVKAFSTLNPALLGLTQLPADLSDSLTLGGVRAYYGAQPYVAQFPQRWVASGFLDTYDTLPYLTMNGDDSSYPDFRVPTRIGLTIYWTRVPYVISTVTAYGPLQLAIGVEWNKLFAAGETQFSFDGFQPTSLWYNAIYSTQCEYHHSTDHPPYIPLDTNHDYSAEDYQTIVSQQRPIPCGGKCDLQCPDNYKCHRHTDCFHGNCNSEGICGSSTHLSYDTVRVSDAMVARAPFILAIAAILAGVFVLI